LAAPAEVVAVVVNILVELAQVVVLVVVYMVLLVHMVVEPVTHAEVLHEPVEVVD
jgi:hypothetical protein